VANHVDLRADDPLGLSRAQFDMPRRKAPTLGHPVQHP
jgi:hypothetical protein